MGGGSAAAALKTLPFVAISTWSGLVYYERHQLPERRSFLRGSFDEVIMDSLDAGDVILFNRKCQWMQVYRPHFRYNNTHLNVE